MEARQAVPAPQPPAKPRQPSLARLPHVRTSRTTLTLIPSARAQVELELELDAPKPWRELTMRGIDPGAEMKRAPHGRQQLPQGPWGPWQPLTMGVTEDALTLTFPEPERPASSGAAERPRRGERAAVWQVRLTYTTDLQALGHIVRLPSDPAGEARVELAWPSPVFTQGVDSAVVRVRLPAVGAMPSVPAEPMGLGLGHVQATVQGAQARLPPTATDNVRYDEVELIRAHLAAGERMLWKVQASAEAVRDTSPALSSSRESDRITASIPKARPGLDARERVGQLLALSAFFGTLVWMKTVLTRRRAREVGATVRPWIPLHEALRASLAATFFASAIWAVTGGENNALAGTCLAGAGLLASLRLEAPPLLLRSAGSWEQLSLGALQVGRGSWYGGLFDAGHPLGLVCLVLTLGPAVAGAALIFPDSPYYGAWAFLSTAAWLPLWLSGRLGPEHWSLAQALRKLLSDVVGVLADDARVQLQLWGRVRAMDGQLDELRLRLLPRLPPEGFVGLELGGVLERRPFGVRTYPALLLRVIDGSKAHQNWPGELVWSQGLAASERTTVLTPPLGSAASVVRLARRVFSQLGLGVTQVEPPVSVPPADPPPVEPQVPKPGGEIRWPDESPPSPASGPALATPG